MSRHWLRRSRARAGQALPQRAGARLRRTGLDDDLRRARRRRRLLAWENEALLALKELGPDKFEIIAPSLSILAEPPVAVVDKNVDRKGTRKTAEAYLQYLYSDEGQEIAAKNYYRPTDAKIAQKYAAQFPKVTLFTIDDAFGGWQKASKTHFADGGTFDQIYRPRAP